MTLCYVYCLYCTSNHNHNPITIIIINIIIILIKITIVIVKLFHYNKKAKTNNYSENLSQAWYRWITIRRTIKIFWNFLVFFWNDVNCCTSCSGHIKSYNIICYHNLWQITGQSWSQLMTSCQISTCLSSGFIAYALSPNVLLFSKKKLLWLWTFPIRTSKKLWQV